MSIRKPDVVVANILLALLLAAPNAPIAAQDSTMVGELVRAELGGGARAEGVVEDWGACALSIRTGSGQVVGFDWPEIRTLERFRSRRRTARAAGLGAAIGGLGVGLAAAIFVEPCTGTGFSIGPSSRGEALFVAGLVGAAVGGIVGLIAGSLIQTPSWEPVVLPTMRPTGPVTVGVRWRRP